MKTKNLIIRAMIALVLMALISLGGLWVVMKNEGYPTIDGVRNLFSRDGKIRIELPADFVITDVVFEGDALKSIEYHGHVAVIRAGYTVAQIRVGFSKPGGKGSIHFGEVKKLNNWNRITFGGKAGADGTVSFAIHENGVPRKASSYSITQTFIP